MYYVDDFRVETINDDMWFAKGVIGVSDDDGWLDVTMMYQVINYRQPDYYIKLEQVIDSKGNDWLPHIDPSDRVLIELDIKAIGDHDWPPKTKGV